MKISLMAIFLITASVSIWLYKDWNQFWQQSLEISEQEFEIHVGESGSSVIKRLNQLKVLSKPRYAKIWLKLFHKKETFKAGTYQISKQLSKQQILLNFIAGKTKQFQITIIPGWTYQQALKKLLDSPYIENDLGEQSLQQLLQLDSIPEGWFFPETYNFPKQYKLSALLKQGKQTMQQQLDEAWRGRDPELQLKTPYELLILASIVEKETALRSEKNRIAGVFTLRLKKRMRLQTDPTVIYGLGELFDGNIKRKHLQQDTVYNTYTRFGLPPTPIALPDKDSLLAVAHPLESGALYFVADGSGGHDFSETLEEHNKKVRKLLREHKI